MAFSSKPAALLAAWRRTLQSFQVFQCERARFEQIGDQHARGPSEQIQKVARQPASELALVDGWLEQLGVADLLDFTHRAFFLESIDECLHRCVSNALILGQTLEYFSDGGGSQFPELLEDSCFSFVKTRFLHISYLSR